MSNLQIQPAPVRRSVVVKADIERAFAAFTGKIGSWWPRGHSVGTTPQVDVVLEGRPGGRWYEVGADGSQCEWGKVLLWQPPQRLVLAWQLDANWKYDPTLLTEVEIVFTALVEGGTRVDLEHRHLERFGPGAAKVREAVDSKEGWQGILESYVSIAEHLGG
jgi:uncharacterized protein YndB with AHSA1/START domain